MEKKVLMNYAFCFVWLVMDGKLKITFYKIKIKIKIHQIFLCELFGFLES